MSEQKWTPQVGDHVWHVCEYALSNAALKAKGLEGFRPYGVEVVESVVKSLYHWKNADQGCMPVSEKRDVGDNANSEFYWKISDYGRSVFSTKEEAAALAGERAHDMDHGIFSTKYNSKPMYKNWMHWDGEEGRKIARQIATKAKGRRGPQRKPLPEGFEKAYTGWRNGELSNAEAARACGMPQTSFQEAAKRELVKRGEVREKFKFIRKHRTSPDDFQAVYEKWRSGKITITEAARECGIDYSSFYIRAHKMMQKEENKKNDFTTIEIASIAIYIVMSTQNAFGEILPKWNGEWDDRSMSLFVAALFAGWFIAPYFAWVMWKWIKKKRKEE